MRPLYAFSNSHSRSFSTSLFSLQHSWSANGKNWRVFVDYKMSHIVRLPEAISNVLCSSYSLADYAQIAEELVSNSIDAHSTKVHVYVDVNTNYIKVEDDGCGVKREDLSLIGQRNATSKLNSLKQLNAGIKTLGFRGQALSSLSEIALLEVTTRARGHANCYKKIIQSCKCLSLGLSDNKQGCGTTVIARDIFYNQPVRRRQHQSSSKKVLQSIKERILQIAIVHPEVEFKVTDMKRGGVLIHTIPSTTSLCLLRGIFGDDFTCDLHPIDFDKGNFRLSGLICKSIHAPSKALQFLYVNSRFVDKTPVHKLLNAFQCQSKNDLLQTVMAKEKFQKDTNQNKLYPAYVLNLSCPQASYDIAFESSRATVEFKDWKPVISFINDTVEEIWGRPFAYPKNMKPETRKRKRWCSSDKSCSAEYDFEALALKSSYLLSDVTTVDELCQEKKSEVMHEQSTDITNRLADRNHETTFSVSHEKDAFYFDSKEVQQHSDVLKTFTRVSDGCYEEEDEGKQLHGNKVSNHRKVFPSFLTSPNCKMADLEADYFYSPEKSYNTLPADSYNKTSFKKKLNIRQEPSNSQTISTEDWTETDFCIIQKSHVCYPNQFSQGLKSFKCGENETSSSQNQDSFTEENYSVGIGFTPKGIFHEDSSSSFSPCSLLSKTALLESYDSQDSCQVTNDVKQCLFIDTGQPTSKNCHSAYDKTIYCFSRLDNEEQHNGGVNAASFMRTSGNMDVKGFKNSKSLSTPLVRWEPFEWEENMLVSSEERNSTSVKESSIPFSPGDDLHPYKSYLQVHPNREEGLSPSIENDFLYEVVETGNNYSYSDTWKPSGEAKSALHSNGLDNVEHNLQDWDTRELHKSKRKNAETQTRDIYHNNVAKKTSSCSFGNLPSRFSRDFLSDMLFSNQSEDSFDTVLHTRREQSSRYKQSCDHSKRRRKRSHSAPPFFRGKRKNGPHMNPSSSLSTNGKADMQYYKTNKHAGPLVRCGEMDKLHNYDHNEDISHKKDIKVSLDTTTLSEIEESHPLQVTSIGKGKTGDEHTSFFVAERSSPLPVPVTEQRTDIISENKMNDWKIPCTSNMEGDILDVSSGMLHLTNGSLIPEAINKACFMHANVLNQVDKKYIVVVAENILAVIDQHAADERIRLEQLRKEVLEEKRSLKVNLLETEQELVLSGGGVQMLQSYSEQITDWGWRYRILSTDNRRKGHDIYRSSSKAFLTAVPCILGVNLTAEDLCEYIEQLEQTDGSSAAPPAVLRILSFKACRGAIMFGDLLQQSECALIVEELKKTSLCFQCAHGRPTTVPLVNLETLHKELKQITLATEKSERQLGEFSVSNSYSRNSAHEGWHGLKKHRANLQRSKMRLI